MRWSERISNGKSFENKSKRVHRADFYSSDLHKNIFVIVKLIKSSNFNLFSISLQTKKDARSSRYRDSFRCNLRHRSMFDVAVATQQCKHPTAMWTRHHRGNADAHQKGLSRPRELQSTELSAKSIHQKWGCRCVKCDECVSLAVPSCPINVTLSYVRVARIFENFPSMKNNFLKLLNCFKLKQTKIEIDV